MRLGSNSTSSSIRRCRDWRSDGRQMISLYFHVFSCLFPSSLIYLRQALDRIWSSQGPRHCSQAKDSPHRTSFSPSYWTYPTSPRRTPDLGPSWTPRSCVSAADQSFISQSWLALSHRLTTYGQKGGAKRGEGGNGPSLSLQIAKVKCRPCRGPSLPFSPFSSSVPSLCLSLFTVFPVPGIRHLQTNGELSCFVLRIARSLAIISPSIQFY